MHTPLSSAELVDALQRLGFRVRRCFATGLVLEGKRRGGRRVVIVEDEASLRVERLAVLLAAADVTLEELVGHLAPGEPTTLTRRRALPGDDDEPTNDAA